MKQEKKQTYSLYLLTEGEEAIDLLKLSEETQKELFRKLRKQMIEDGLHGIVCENYDK